MGSGVQMMREQFEAQFERSSDDNYVYRRNQKGEPIPVSREERERFIQQYMWRIRLIIAGMVVVLCGFIGVLLWWMIATQGELPEFLFYVVMIAISVVAIALMYWVRGAPARELEGRNSVGRERSRDEMRAIFFRKLSYGQLAGAAFVGLILPFTLRSHPDVFHGWNRLWLVLSAVIVLVAVIEAFRKWRFDKETAD